MAHITRTRPHFIKYSLIALAVVAAVGGLWVALRPPVVQVVQPARGPVVDAVYASGTVEPEVMFPVAARATGRLSMLLADEGDTVAPGQILAQLEASDLTAGLLQLKAKEAEAKAQFQRAERLLPLGGTSRAAYDTAHATYKAAVQARNAAQAQVGYTQLSSMVTATVIYRDGEVGQLIPAGQTVFWLAEPDKLRVSVNVDEEDIPQVQPGQRVVMRTDAFPQSTFEGIVNHVTPKGDAEARTFRVRISLPSSTPLRIGMTVETNIVLRTEENALLIPTSAMKDKTVWKVVNGKLAEQALTVGVVGTSQTEVLAGLTASDTLVKTYSTHLHNGQRVWSTH